MPTNHVPSIDLHYKLFDLLSSRPTTSSYRNITYTTILNPHTHTYTATNQHTTHPTLTTTSHIITTTFTSIITLLDPPPFPLSIPLSPYTHTYSSKTKKY